MGKEYIISRKIAAGGMAEVLLAARTGISGFEKLVVLKRILAHLKEDGQFLQMFLNEARLAALLKHPNIVEIYDVERTGGDFVVVMEYLSGEDLRYIIGHLRQERQPMDVGVACRIISDAAAALHFAHTATDMDGKPMSVVHRDVAPGNILVTYDGVTKLLDFGIAKATTRATYTVPGTMKGKFAYMSPEHIQQLPLDGRSDIFSLGVVFWELLAAQRLFKGTNDAAVLKQVMEREVPPPSSFNPDLPPALDEIVMRCLARDHVNRAPSARHLREQLEELLIQTGRYVTTSQVAEWMKDTLPWRYHQRKEMERAVVREARSGTDATPAPVTPVRATPPETAAGAITGPPATPEAGGPMMPSPPPQAPMAQAPMAQAPMAQAPMAQAPMAQAPPLFPGSRTAPGSGTAPSSRPSWDSSIGPAPTPIGGMNPGMGARPSIPAYALPPPRRNALLIVAISALVTLLLVALAGAFYYLGSRINEKTATMVVHAVPEGSTLTVNGKVRSREVGAAGTPVSVRPNLRLQLILSKPGRIAQKQTIITPDSGARHVYFTLPRARR